MVVSNLICIAKLPLNLLVLIKVPLRGQDLWAMVERIIDTHPARNYNRNDAMRRGKSEKAHSSISGNRDRETSTNHEAVQKR